MTAQRQSTPGCRNDSRMARTRAQMDETARALKQLLDDEDRDGWVPMDAPPLSELPTQLGQVVALMIPQRQ